MYFRQITKWIAISQQNIACFSTVINPAITTANLKPSESIDPLKDTYGRRHTYLRISLTEKCNLRCKYCMPVEGVTLTKRDKLLSTDELIQLAKVFVQQGVSKIRLTGGEPTVRKDIVHIIESLKALSGLECVAMTTNGLTLTRQLVPLQRAGLDLINISLDTLKSHKYEIMARRKGFERALAGIDLALQLGYNPVKVNCVVMKGFNDDEILDFVEFTKDKAVDVRFIEYMPFAGNSWKDDKLVTYKQMVDTIKSKWSDFAPLPNQPNDTSKAWQVPGFLGQVGFITSMSEHFCGSCNRIRLTADGNLKVCLFGNAEISLRDALRNNISQDDLVCMIGAAIRRKNKQHAVIDTAKFSKDYNKYYIKSPTTNNFLHNILNVNYSNIRSFTSSSDKLSHVDESGNATMVDVGGKAITRRTAEARGSIEIGERIVQLIKYNQIKKGDVLTVAKIAGILAAKRTSELIPLCHNIPLSKVDVDLKISGTKIIITSTATCEGQTGVEMEALTAVAVTALTVYDMCKSVSHNLKIEDIYLVRKEGGKSGYVNKKSGPEEIIKIKYNKEPIKTDEYFYPVHV